MIVNKICAKYGDLVSTIDGDEYYSFPNLEQLKTADEAAFREIGLGYRAPYLEGTIRIIEEKGGLSWLEGLKGAPHEHVKQELLCLPGIGPKAADCIALMCLDQTGAIPVDTHVWKIACRDYLPELSEAKSITPKIYKKVGDKFREVFGPYAGWAHTVLFAAELRDFKDRAPPSEGKLPPTPKEKREAAKERAAQKKRRKLEALAPDAESSSTVAS